jgi:hypothetical protein
VSNTWYIACESTLLFVRWQCDTWDTSMHSPPPISSLPRQELEPRRTL